MNETVTSPTAKQDVARSLRCLLEAVDRALPAVREVEEARAALLESVRSGASIRLTTIADTDAMRHEAANA
jgi:hypothetical protein